jgi:hypothetical protein
MGLLPNERMDAGKRRDAFGLQIATALPAGQTAETDGNGGGLDQPSGDVLEAGDVPQNKVLATLARTYRRSQVSRTRTTIFRPLQLAPTLG